MEMKDRIKQIRIDNKMSQETFGKEIDLTKGTVSKIENGKAFPGRETIERISKRFNVTTDYIYGESEEKDLTADKYNKFKEIMEWLDKLPEDKEDIALQQMLAIAQTLGEHHKKSQK
ncbi:helix-turn-helix domain-containing protein [Bacillus mycoides]|uniref:helix-turn-helix domain-containing protein n=1 Tax=Bacillus mycoides TaxID=1405 RepID=UPI0021111093|nr:helix-turn-helix transcriptional regulator [Bacillus mycoides]MCQ6527889.1 helix-turn-helix domain-containing protein [Bacillus mycoides]